MDFKQLECFVEVINKKSFSKAAEALYMSQPAVTSNVQKLELELGVDLIDRTGKGASTTTFGELLYKNAVEMLNLREKTFSVLSEYNRFSRSKLDIYSSSIPEEYIIPRILKKFKSKELNIYCRLHSCDSKKVIDNIAAGRANIGFTGAKLDRDNINYVNIYTDSGKMISSISKDFPKKITLKDLKGENLVLREEGSGTRRIFDMALDKSGLNIEQFGSVTISESAQSIKKMVEFGLGISFISELAIQDEVKSAKLKAYDVEELSPGQSFYFLWANDRHLSAAEESFRDFILLNYKKVIKQI